MTFASVYQFHIYLPLVNARMSLCHSVLNVKGLVGTFNQEKALVGAFSVIVTTDWSFAALYSSYIFTFSPVSRAAAVNLITANIINI